MSKFSNKSGSEDKGRSRARNDKRPGKSSAGEDEKKNYKTKRSFTKNKSFRDTKDAKTGDRPRKPYSGIDDRKPFKKEFDGEKSSAYGDKPKRSYGDRDDKKPFNKDFSKDKYGEKPRRPYKDSEERKPFKKEGFGSKEDKFERPKRSGDSSGERKSFRDSDGRPKRNFDESRPKRDPEERSKRAYDDRKPSRDEDSKPRRSFDDARPARDSEERPRRRTEDVSDKKSYKKVIKSKDDKFDGFKKATGKYANSPKPARNNDGPAKRRLTKPRKTDEGEFTKRVKYDEFEEGKAFTPQTSRERSGDKRSKKPAPIPKQTGADGLMRLNKYLSNAGVASRRDADNLIVSGTVKVNGVVVDQLGTKISPTDKVTYGDAAVRAERKVYLLLNKPKDYITTVDDPKERKTVMELVKGACRERIYPVGRLDRNTTGLLLFTNDGEMTTKLTHPKFGVKKIYQVSLNKGLRPEDFKAITEGLELEDGIVKADDLAFVGEGKKEVGIEIHSGRNRIVRRIFEHLGYDVLKLDRVVFAGLTKKDLPRGKHRFLTGKEISFLQMIG